MAKLIFGMMQSLDGYVAGIDGGLERLAPGPLLAQHFNEYVRSAAGFLYGRRIYETMQYWDEERSDWDDSEIDFANVWRAKPKWVVSRTLKSVGPNATLVGEGVEDFVRRLKAEVEGVIDVAGPELAGGLSDLGLIDEYHLYYRPLVLGDGKPYFNTARPSLRLVETNRIGEDASRLVLVPT